MTQQAIPATRIQVDVCPNLAVFWNLQVRDGAIVKTASANVTKGTKEFLGDENGVPQQELNLGPGMVSPMVNVPLPLDEVVTRADGSKVTVMGLLEAIAMAAQPPAPPTPPKVPGA
jgi:hypothetical protein